MNTVWLSISAGNGPEECAYAASLTVKALLQEIQSLPENSIKVDVKRQLRKYCIKAFLRYYRQ